MEEYIITSENSFEVQANGKSSYNCSPLNSIYYNLKLRLAGGLNEADLNGLYRCTLCNGCGLAGLNRGAREMAVSKDVRTPHLARFGKNIEEYGNPYGVPMANEDDGSSVKETLLFRGCTPAYRAPEILSAVESLLKRKGIEYGVMGDETCCGNILFNLGDKASGMKAVRRNIAKFKAAGVKRIITLCPGCYNAFNKYYKGIDGFDPEVILALELMGDMSVPGEGYRVQDPCHAKEKGHIVREIVAGAGNRSLSQCCGAGSGVMTHDRLLATTKARKATGSGHGKIVTYCPFCYLNLSSVDPGNVADLYVLLAGRYQKENVRPNSQHVRRIPVTAGI